jgi:hypothetical protein
VRVFTVSRQALESDMERLRHDLALAEAAARRAELEGK